ncbi:hypothetical protein ACT4UT_09690 [Bacillus sp. B-TM1]
MTEITEGAIEILGVIELESHHGDNITVSKDPEATRPHLRKVNMVLTILLMIALIKGILPMSVLFMLAFCIAMLITPKRFCS